MERNLIVRKEKTFHIPTHGWVQCAIRISTAWVREWILSGLWNRRGYRGCAKSLLT